MYVNQCLNLDIQTYIRMSYQIEFFDNKKGNKFQFINI